MPLYEYSCKACDHRFERIVKFSDAPLKICPECGRETIEQVISAPAIQFKGSGWYVNDYARKSSPASSSSSKMDSSSGSAADNKGSTDSGASSASGGAEKSAASGDTGAKSSSTNSSADGSSSSSGGEKNSPAKENK